MTEYEALILKPVRERTRPWRAIRWDPSFQMFFLVERGLFYYAISFFSTYEEAHEYKIRQQKREKEQLLENEHNWSGWPGAYCLNCGVEDQNEVCVNECDWVNRSYEEYMSYYDRNGYYPREGWVNPVGPCPIHINGPCPDGKLR